MGKWRKATLHDLVELQRGYDLPVQRRQPGSVPVMGGGGMNGCHAKANVNGPGVVIGRSGAGFGTAFYCSCDYWAHNTVLFVKDFKGNHPRYVYYFLDSFDFSRYNSGGAQPSLNRNFIYPIDILVPPFSEQKLIAQILNIWDAAIVIIERLIAEKEERYSALVQTLINHQLEKWEHLRVEKIFKTISEKKNDGETLLSVTQNRGVIPRSMLKGRVMSPQGSTDSYKLIQPGDFAISLRSFQGGIEYSDYRGIISPAYTVLRPRLDINTEFYRHFFKTHLFINKYLNIAVIGIRDGKQISIPDFMTVKIPYPPLGEQERIAEILDLAKRDLYTLRQLVGVYRKQKRGLMQKLLAGTWHVRFDEAG